MRTKPSPIVWVILGTALLLVYAMFNRAPKRQSVDLPAASTPASKPDPTPRGLTAPESPVAGSVNTDAKIPDWVPLYPGTTPMNVREQTLGIEQSLSFELQPRNGNCRDFYNFYFAKLNEGGFHVHADNYAPYGSGGGTDYCPAGMTGEAAGHTRTIYMRANSITSGYSILIQVIQRKRLGGPDGKSESAFGAMTGPAPLPTWVPIYPGTTPQFMDNRTVYGGERRIGYSFRSTDDAKKVISFFEQKLNALAFRVTSDYTATNGPFLQSNDGKRTFNIYSARPGSAPMFHVEVTDIP